MEGKRQYFSKERQTERGAKRMFINALIDKSIKSNILSTEIIFSTKNLRPNSGRANMDQLIVSP